VPGVKKTKEMLREVLGEPKGQQKEANMGIFKPAESTEA
jgi:hypothetical protein